MLGATAGADGSYEISGIRGAGEIRARSGSLRATETVDLSAGPVTRDIVLVGPRTYDAHLRLFVRPAGAGTEIGPIPLDWRTAVHYGLRLTVDGVEQRLLTREPEPDGSVVVQVLGTPGQVLRWCITGYETRLANTCMERVLTIGDRSPVLEMHAGPGIKVNMNLVDTHGVPVFGAATNLYEVTDSGRTYVSGTYGAGGRVSAQVPRPGTYVVESHHDDLSAERTFTIDRCRAQRRPGQPGAARPRPVHRRRQRRRREPLRRAARRGRRAAGVLAQPSVPRWTVSSPGSPYPATPSWSPTASSSTVDRCRPRPASATSTSPWARSRLTGPARFATGCAPRRPPPACPVGSTCATRAPAGSPSSRSTRSPCRSSRSL